MPTSRTGLNNLVSVQVVVIDEIGTEAEAVAARTISQRGVQLIATAHGNELDNLMKNPSLVDLVGGISSVILGTCLLALR
jgi:stage III sporulation protein SpoIIIAA